MQFRLNPSPRSDDHEAGLLPVATLVLWSACVCVGVVGLIWPRRPAAPAPVPPPIDAMLLNVETVSERATAQVQPSTPDLPPVAAPGPTIVFAEPVNAPVHIVESPRAEAIRAPIIQLTFGRGEGQQPAPEYPPEAVLAAQEGTVIVRLTVDESGRVTDAIASSPCSWPLLNSAAVRAVRNTWRFPKGPVRSYQVAIEFQLNRHE